MIFPNFEMYTPSAWQFGGLTTHVANVLKPSTISRKSIIKSTILAGSFVVATLPNLWAPENTSLGQANVVIRESALISTGAESAQIVPANYWKNLIAKMQTWEKVEEKNDFYYEPLI